MFVWALPIHHAHLARTGGSELCACAKKHHTTPLYPRADAHDGNCWPRSNGNTDFGPRWFPLTVPEGKVRPFWADSGERRNETCDSLVEKTRKWTWVSNEAGVYGPCPQFRNVIQLRDPMDRLVSHVAFLLEDLERPDAYVRFEGTLMQLVMHAPAIVDNAAIRFLLGDEGRELPFGAVTTLHLQRAKDVLGRFDVVAIVGEHNTTRTLGFPCARQFPPAPRRRLFSEDELREITALNRLDAALFQYARSLVA